MAAVITRTSATSRSTIILRLTLVVFADNETHEGVRESAGHPSLWPVHCLPLQCAGGEYRVGVNMELPASFTPVAIYPSPLTF